MSKKAQPSQFPDRVVLAVGFPWAMGMGKKNDPYSGIMMLKDRMGVSPKLIAFPKLLWSRDIPKYRLVLERV